MIKSRWYLHPLVIFIFSLAALATSLYIYLRTYLKVTGAIQKIVAKHNLKTSQFLDMETWVVVLTLSLLVGLIVVGIALIYTYYQKMILLLRQQQNFISGFTHELKTPVASLQLFIDTMSRHELPRDQQVHYLNLMKRDTERLSDNIHQILHLARLEDKKEKREFSRLDIVKFLRDLIRNHSHSLEKLDVTVDDSVFSGEEDKRRFVLLHKGLIEILFMNIFVNAIKYKGQSDPKVQIDFVLKNKKLEIHIRDRGIGLTREQQKHIFKKFYQVQRTGKGSGIGLYIAQLIAKIHKGEIRVQSPGLKQGTKMIVSLPYADKV